MHLKKIKFSLIFPSKGKSPRRNAATDTSCEYIY